MFFLFIISNSNNNFRIFLCNVGVYLDAMMVVNTEQGDW